MMYMKGNSRSIDYHKCINVVYYNAYKVQNGFGRYDYEK